MHIFCAMPPYHWRLAMFTEGAEARLGDFLALAVKCDRLALKLIKVVKRVYRGVC
jgi:hypothetical protein